MQVAFHHIGGYTNIIRKGLNPTIIRTYIGGNLDQRANWQRLEFTRGDILLASLSKAGYPVQGSELPFLSQWQNFYMIMGTAAATLTGLMFVVTTLIASIDARLSTLNAAVSAFNTPTVVQFGAVLLLAGMLSAPWQTFSRLSLLLGLAGLGMVLYSIVVLRRMRRVPKYQATLEDWLWYLGFPLLAHVSLIVAALMLPRNPAAALYIVGSAMILLLLVGIRNAWDMVTFLAVERAHAESNHEEG